MEIFIVVTGAIVGSFLCLVIDRLPAKKDILFERSHCNQCQTPLKFINLIPIVSFLLAQGRCVHCDSKLSFRYLKLEILTALLFLINYLYYGINTDFIFSLVFISILIIITFIDYDTMIINDSLQILILISALCTIVYNQGSFKYHLMGACIISIPYGLLAIATKSIGGGDVKLSFTAGLYLGVHKVLIGFTMAILTAGVYALFLLIIEKKSMKTEMPFGPHLCFGFYVASFSKMTVYLVNYLM